MKRIQYNSPVILTFFFLSLAALVLDRLTGGWTNLYLFSVYRSPISPLFFVRLLGHVLEHPEDNTRPRLLALAAEWRSESCENG